VEKRWIEANRKYRAGKSELVDRLRIIRDGAIEAMNGAARDLSVRRGEFDGILKGRSRLGATFSQNTRTTSAGPATLFSQSIARRNRESPPKHTGAEIF